LGHHRIFILLSLIANMSFFYALLAAPAPKRAWSRRAQAAVPYLGGVCVALSYGFILQTYGLLRPDAFAAGLAVLAIGANALCVRVVEAWKPEGELGAETTSYRQLGGSVVIGLLFTAVHYAVFSRYTGNPQPAMPAFLTGAAFTVSCAFLTLRLLHQHHIDRTDAGRSPSAAYTAFLAFLIGHGMLGCMLIVLESFGIAPHPDGFFIEYATMFAMTAMTVVVGERQYVAKRKQWEWNHRRLRHIAFHDSLTGLPNRMYANEHLDERVRSGAPCFVMLIDLDQFKQVNDWLGHQAGDYLLAMTAERLRGAAAPGDLVARLGGDEFLVIGDAANAEAALPTAERILRAVSEPLPYEDYVLHVSASIGIAHVPVHAAAAGEAMKHADLAMYRAKERGRDGVCIFSREVDLPTVEDQRMKQELKRVLEGRDLELHYQPQVDLRTGRIAGFEALLRWNREGAAVPPERFVALAEQNGAIERIGAWALREACRQTRTWNAVFGLRLRVAVNVSYEQLRKCDFVDRVEGILVESGLDASLLELEITESAAMRDAPLAIGQVSKLRDLGVQVGIDDFGTGYSAFANLKRLAFDRVKIDRSFIVGLPHRGEDRAIVKAMLTMARELGLKTTAEGVERSDQLAYLKSLGCDEIQGYYYSKPLRPNEVEVLLSDDRVGA